MGRAPHGAGAERTRLLPREGSRWFDPAAGIPGEPAKLRHPAHVSWRPGRRLREVPSAGRARRASFFVFLVFFRATKKKKLEPVKCGSRVMGLRSEKPSEQESCQPPGPPRKGHFLLWMQDSAAPFPPGSGKKTCYK